MANDGVFSTTTVTENVVWCRVDNKAGEAYLFRECDVKRIEPMVVASEAQDEYVPHSMTRICFTDGSQTLIDRISSEVIDHVVLSESDVG